MFKETHIFYTFPRTLESQHWGGGFNYPLLTMKIRRKTKEKHFYQQFRVQIEEFLPICSSSSSPILVPQVPFLQPSFLISA